MREGRRARERNETDGTRTGERHLFSARGKRARRGGKSREVDVAKVKAAIRVTHGIPGAIGIGRDLCLKPGVESSRIDEGRRRGGEGMGESLERRGVPSEVDLARGPAVGVAGTRGGKRGGVRRGPQRTTGTRCRALRGGKGGGRAFGRRPRKRGEARRKEPHEKLGGKVGQILGTRQGRRQRGCRTLGTRQGRGRRGGRGVTSHGNGADGVDRGDRSRGGDHRGGSTTNRSSTDSSALTSRRGWLERGIQPRADLLAESLPLETGQGRGR